MTKKEIALKELPFLKRVAEDIAERVRIERIDEGLLNHTPTYHYWDGSLGVTHKEEKILILTEKRIYSVEQEGESGSNYAHSQRQYYHGEKVIDAIIRHDIRAEEIVAVVKTVIDRNDWPGQTYTNEKWTIVYLPMKDKEKFASLIREARDKLEDSVLEEIQDARGQ